MRGSTTIDPAISIGGLPQKWIPGYPILALCGALRTANLVKPLFACASGVDSTLTSTLDKNQVPQRVGSVSLGTIQEGFLRTSIGQGLCVPHLAVAENAQHLAEGSSLQGGSLAMHT